MSEAAPYPADTRAKGWRFEIDTEKLDQSDTWALAAADVRPWLLMLWMTAWKQTPCGSLVQAEELIAARIGMPAKTFAKHRAVLMRGWWLADDGRLYHDTIIERVQAMLAKRATDAQRAAARRERNADAAVSHAEVTRDKPVTTPEVRPEFDTKHQAPVTSNQKEKGERRKRLPAPEGVDEGVWSDWLALRATKRAPVSETVLREARGEAAKAGLTLEAFLRIWCLRGSQGLMADWLRADERGNAPTFRERDAANAAARVAEMTGGLVAAKPIPITRRNDALQEVFDANDAPRRLG